MNTFFNQWIQRIFGRTDATVVQRAARVWPLEVNHADETWGRAPEAGLAALCDVAARHVWVHKAINQVAATVAGVPFKVWRQTPASAGPELVATHPLLRLIQRPNPHYTGFELVELWLKHLLCTGMSFTAVEAGGQELWPLHPARVRILPDRHNYIRGYRYETGAARITFAPEEVLYLRLPDPRPGHELFGLGPVAAARLGLTLDLNAITANQAFFENGARPFMVLEVPGQLAEEHYQRLRQQWSNLHQGPANAKRMAIVEAGIKVHEVGLSAQDMEWIALRKLAREEILAVLGVPPILAGLLEGTTYANSDQQRQVFVEHLETMYLHRLGARLTESFRSLGLLRTEEWCAWDTTELKTDALGIDRRTLAAQRAVQTALMSPNEARRVYFNLPPYPGGDCYFPPAGTGPAQLPPSEVELGMDKSPRMG